MIESCIRDGLIFWFMKLDLICEVHCICHLLLMVADFTVFILLSSGEITYEIKGISTWLPKVVHMDHTAVHHNIVLYCDDIKKNQKTE